MIRLQWREYRVIGKITLQNKNLKAHVILNKRKLLYIKTSLSEVQNTECYWKCDYSTTDVWVKLNIDHPGGKGTPLCGLYRDMPLDRYGFLASLSWAGYTASLNSVLIMQGQNLS